MHKNPEQTAATRQKIMDSFWSIYEHKDIRKITIGGVMRLAGYNRGTFYEYFTDIYDVLNQIEDDLLETVIEGIHDVLRDKKPSNITEYSLMCSTVFKKYVDKLSILLGPSGDPQFETKLQSNFGSVFRLVSPQVEEPPHFDYILTFAYSAIRGLLTHWYNAGKEMPEEEFLSMAHQLVASGTMGYLNIDFFPKDDSQTT